MERIIPKADDERWFDSNLWGAGAALVLSVLLHVLGLLAAHLV